MSSSLPVLSRRGVLFAGALASVLSAIVGPRVQAAEGLTVLAAATLQEALDEAAVLYQKEGGSKVTVSYGATPALVKQMESGAPADLFFSADADWMDQAQQKGLIRPETRKDLLSSRLVLIAPAASDVKADIAPGFPLAKLLGDGKLAMCEPMMMPAGRYGRAALQKLGVWASVQDRVANAENIRAALAYVSRREAPLGIVFDTDAALDKGVKVVGVFPADSHPPIVYPLAVTVSSKNPEAAKLVAFLASPKAKPVFEKYGFTLSPRP